MPMNTHSSGELIRFIEAAGENANIDAKGPMEWNGGEASAGLTKDILGLANSRDGGVIVIGKVESQPGKFVLSGVAEAEASSFETTKVATWVTPWEGAPWDSVFSGVPATRHRTGAGTSAPGRAGGAGRARDRADHGE